MMEKMVQYWKNRLEVAEEEFDAEVDVLDMPKVRLAHYTTIYLRYAKSQICLMLSQICVQAYLQCLVIFTQSFTSWD